MSARCPGAIAPIERPSACAPPAHAASCSRRPVERFSSPSALRLRCVRRCAYSSPRSSSAAETRTSESEPTPKRPPLARKLARIEHAVAEIGLGDRAQPGDGARRGDQLDLRRRRVRRVDQAPARIDRDRVVQELDRTLAVRGERILDLLHLLGDMDVHRPVRPALGDPRKVGEGDGAQRMRRDAELRIRKPGDRPRARLDEALEAVAVAEEPALALNRRRAAEIALGVERPAAASARCRSRRPPPRCARPSRRCCRKGARPARGAGSGTRRPR